MKPTTQTDTKAGDELNPSPQGLGLGESPCSAYMPVMGYFDYKTHRYIPETKIPWGMIEAHDEQAKLNHCNQGLERLRQRGGVSACEALAILDDREWEMMDDAKAYGEVVRRVDIFLQNNALTNPHEILPQEEP